MNKCCRNCKWYSNYKCNCKDINNTFSVKTKNNGIAYVEDGILAETVREQFNFKELKNLIADKLNDEKYLKKTKNIDKFNLEDIEENIIELIDDSLCKSIMNYFNNNNFELNLNLNNINSFHCYYWE